MTSLLHREPPSSPARSLLAFYDDKQHLPSQRAKTKLFVLLGFAVTVLASGCLDPTSVSPYPNSDQRDFQVRSVSVQQGARNQPLDRPLVISFTDRVDAASLNRTNFRFSREGRPLPSILLRQDMVRCSVTIDPFEDLEPGSVYELKLSRDLESTSGVRLGTDFSVTFTTGNETVGQPPRRPVTNETVQEQVFQRHCGCCHDPQTGAYAHILALDADSLTGLRSRARPDLALVVPGSHEESYLLHKVLGLPGIAGEPMPPPDLACGAPWPRSRMCNGSDADLTLLGEWIFDLGHEHGESTP